MSAQLLHYIMWLHDILPLGDNGLNDHSQFIQLYIKQFKRNVSILTTLFNFLIRNKTILKIGPENSVTNLNM